MFVIVFSKVIQIRCFTVNYLLGTIFDNPNPFAFCCSCVLCCISRVNLLCLPSPWEKSYFCYLCCRQTYPLTLPLIKCAIIRRPHCVISLQRSVKRLLQFRGDSDLRSGVLFFRGERKKSNARLGGQSGFSQARKKSDSRVLYFRVPPKKERLIAG